MRQPPSEFVEQHRIRTGRFATTPQWGNNGAFLVPGPEHHKLFCIVSDQDGWEHVSISLARKPRIPTWAEMCYIKDLFWGEEECVVQYHPPKADYVSFEDTTLHLWKPVAVLLPRPPHTMVAPKNLDETLRLLETITGKKVRL